jgi:hypothetical protein
MTDQERIDELERLIADRNEDIARVEQKLASAKTPQEIRAAVRAGKRKDEAPAPELDPSEQMNQSLRRYAGKQPDEPKGEQKEEHTSWDGGARQSVPAPVDPNQVMNQILRQRRSE